MIVTIPPITDPIGASWEQPDPAGIVIDDNTATMTLADWDKLHIYNASLPTGVYAGKMWGLIGHDGTKWLRWFAPSDTPGHCLCYSRRVVIKDGSSI